MSGNCRILEEQLNNLRQQFEDLKLRQTVCEELSQSPVPDEAEAGERCLDNVGRRSNDLYFQIRAAERAFRACLEPVEPQTIKIDGIEQTQAIQFFRPPLSPCPDRPNKTRCPENDIQLVAGKTTVLRVYVDVPPGDPSINILSGVLETRQSDGPWNLPLTPYNAPVVARRAINIDRGNAAHTLNFRIPASWCYDTLEVKLTIFDSLHPGEERFTSTPQLKIINFRIYQPLKLRLVRIRYKNDARGMDLPAPSIEDFWTTAEYVLKTFPIPEIQIIRNSVMLYDGDFTSYFNSGGPGARGTTGVIFQILNDLISAESLPSDVLYLALIPAAPANQTAPGWAAGGKSISVASGRVMAQEIGHNRGFAGHAPCPPPGVPGSPGGIDQNYSNYAGYPSGSIGEFGFDVVDSTVYDPSSYYDFMSYCGPTWVSPYTYEILSRRFALSTTTIQPVEIVHRQIELLYLFFTISHDGVVIAEENNFHTLGFETQPAGIRTPYVIELHGNKGHILEVKRLYLDDVHRSLDEAYLDFYIALPWHEDANKLILKNGEKLLHSIKIGKVIPEVEFKLPKGGGTLKGKQKIDWVANCNEKTLSYILQYSNDGGQSWHGLATRLTSSEFTVDLDTLPGGKKCLFQVLASEGIRTGVATTNPFIVPLKPVIPLIISPKNSDSFVQGESVHFFGVAHSAGSFTEANAINWSSSIDGFLGSGSELIVHTLSLGRHCITVNVDDGCDGESSTNIYIRIRPKKVVRKVRKTSHDSLSVEKI